MFSTTITNSLSEVHEYNHVETTGSHISFLTLFIAVILNNKYETAQETSRRFLVKIVKYRSR